MGAFQGRFGPRGAFGYQSDSTGLQLLGHRYYDPAVGRFLSPDPIKDGRNWYAYCENNPLTAADPSGLVAPIIVGGVLIAGAILCSGCTGNDAVDTAASAVVPSSAGEVGGALEGGPTGAAAAIRLRERHRAQEELANDPHGEKENPGDNFDVEGNPHQNETIRKNLEREAYWPQKIKDMRLFKRD